MEAKQEEFISWINILDLKDDELKSHFFDDLEKDFWEWDKCFNCKFCWDIASETWKNQDAVLECLGLQSWVDNLKLWDVCAWHIKLEEYDDILTNLKNWN